MNNTFIKIAYLFKEEEILLVFKIILFVITGLLIVFILRAIFMFFEMIAIKYFRKKQFFTHFYLRRKKLPEVYRLILKAEFSFYNKLNHREQKDFEHRIQYFINSWQFIGREVEVDKIMEVKIAATATKLTFGFRDYKIKGLDKVIIYPNIYYSTVNKKMHKGEFNMAYSALVFSWEDFEEGYAVENDNLNLGVHECIHALHLSFLKARKYSTSAAIFLSSYRELTATLYANETLKQKLISSGYFRDYAFENQFEFISVLVENFIETPIEFQSQFPKIYAKVKQMLNFNFAGY